MSSQAVYIEKQSGRRFLYGGNRNRFRVLLIDAKSGVEYPVTNASFDRDFELEDLSVNQASQNLDVRTDCS